MLPWALSRFRVFYFPSGKMVYFSGLESRYLQRPTLCRWEVVAFWATPKAPTEAGIDDVLNFSVIELEIYVLLTEVNESI